jgi:type VII secretion integral membrane protein EccD
MAPTGEMCHVSICTGDREVDVMLPAQLPIAELMPAVVDLVGGVDVDGADPHLARVGGEMLDPAATLAQLAVPDGDRLILTASVRAVPAPRFDASTAVVAVVDGLTPAPWPGHWAARVVLGWVAAILVSLLGRGLLDANDVRHPAVAAAAASVSLAGAVAVQRAHRDQRCAVGLAVLAAVFAGLTGALACLGSPWPPSFLLALSAVSATSLLAWRLLDCAPLVFLPLAGVAMAAAAATVGAVADWWPAAAVGPMLGMGAIVVLAVSTTVAVLGSGLSAAGLCDNELDTRTATAHRRLTALVVAASAAAGLGAILAAATTPRPLVAAGFIATVATGLLLQTSRHNCPYHVAALAISAGCAVTSLIWLSAAEVPASTPWLCGGLLVVAFGAAWSGRHRPGKLRPAARRMISLLDLAVGAIVVPSAGAAAGIGLL